jgi:hypothetical protein
MRLTARGWMWQRYDRLSWPSPRQWQGTTLMAPGLAWNVAEENYLLVAPPEGIAIALARFQEWAESGNAGFWKVWHVQDQSARNLADAPLGKGYPLRKELSATAGLLERVLGRCPRERHVGLLGGEGRQLPAPVLRRPCAGLANGSGMPSEADHRRAFQDESPGSRTIQPAVADHE